MKPILILLSVFLFAGCESDFDKCMDARTQPIYEKTFGVEKLERELALAEKLGEDWKVKDLKAKKEWEMEAAERRAKEICNYQGLYE